MDSQEPLVQNPIIQEEKPVVAKEGEQGQLNRKEVKQINIEPIEPTEKELEQIREVIQDVQQHAVTESEEIVQGDNLLTPNIDSINTLSQDILQPNINNKRSFFDQLKIIVLSFFSRIKKILLS